MSKELKRVLLTLLSAVVMTLISIGIYTLTSHLSDGLAIAIVVLTMLTYSFIYGALISDEEGD